MPVLFKKITKYCLYCGNRLVLNNTRDIQRKKFCSRSCSTTYHQPNNMLGKKHSQKTKELISKAKTTTGIRHYRRSIFEVTNSPCCVICSSDYRLEAHHVDFNRNNNSLSNLKILCVCCHRKLHRNESFREAVDEKLQEVSAHS